MVAPIGLFMRYVFELSSHAVKVFLTVAFSTLLLCVCCLHSLFIVFSHLVCIIYCMSGVCR